MDDIAAPDPALVLLLEFHQGIRRITGAGLNLNGVHLIFCLAVIRDNEINLNIITPLFFAVMRVEE